MPFQSEKQRRYLFANKPKIAKNWTKKYGSKTVKKSSGGFTVVRPRGFNLMLPDRRPVTKIY